MSEDKDPLTDADLAEIEARAAKATEGPWEWWTSNSWRRLTPEGGREGGVICPVKSRSDGHPDLIVSEADMDFIAAARLDVPRLCAALREARAKDGPEHDANDDLAEIEAAAAALDTITESDAKLLAAVREGVPRLCVALREARAERDAGWVSIEEGLPDTDTAVLAKCATGDDYRVLWIIPGTERWDCDDWRGMEGMSKDFVTHWRLLPEPPKG